MSYGITGHNGNFSLIAVRLHSLMRPTAPAYNDKIGWPIHSIKSMDNTESGRLLNIISY